MKLIVLGCGDAFASAGRYNTSFLLEEGGERILVDCGASTLIRLKQLNIDVSSINTIVITHFHGDHYGGIPFLMLSKYFECQEKTDLTIIGPRGIKDKSMILQEALYPGTSNIVDEMGIRHLEYEKKMTMKHDEIDIYARQVTHSPPSSPHGIKLIWKGKSFGFSGDTEWDENLIDLAKETDLFIVECNNIGKESAGHLSYETLQKNRSLLKSKRIMLTHMNSNVLKENELEFDRLEDGMVVEF